jgi:hypothetical protein
VKRSSFTPHRDRFRDDEWRKNLVSVIGHALLAKRARLPRRNGRRALRNPTA